MAVVRLIFITVDATKVDEAVSTWKNECAPLMISSPGCLSEELLQGRENPGEFISYSMWDSMESVERYRHSEEHRRIKEHGRPLSSDQSALVKHYELAG